jgi:glutaredoxin
MGAAVAEYIVYGRPGCPWCDKAKELLGVTRQDFTYVDLSQNPEKRAELIAAGHRTVPQVYHGDKLVGGFEQLSDYLEDRTVG